MTGFIVRPLRPFCLALRSMRVGDGFLSVVTPVSPVGKAVLGKRAGDTVEETVKGEPRESTITLSDQARAARVGGLNLTLTTHKHERNLHVDVKTASGVNG